MSLREQLRAGGPARFSGGVGSGTEMQFPGLSDKLRIGMESDEATILSLASWDADGHGHYFIVSTKHLSLSSRRYFSLTKLCL